MGTMEKIRNTSPYFLAAFAVIFIGFMVASDADIGSLLQQGQNYQTAEIGSVNGEPIYYQEFEKKVQELVEQERQRLEEGEEVDDIRIRKQLWNQMVEEIILKQQAEKAGITVTDEEIRDIMIENPPRQLAQLFTDSTGFNRQAYLMYLTQPEKIQFPEQWTEQQKQEQLIAWREQVRSIEEQLRDQKLRQSISILAGTASSILTDEFAFEQYKKENSSAGVDIVFLNAREVSDAQVSVTDDEIKKYYEKHKEAFKEEAMRRVRYVIFKMEPSKSDTNRANSKVTDMNKSLMAQDTPEGRDSVFDVKMSEYGGIAHDYTLVSDVDPRLKPYLEELKPMEISGPLKIGDSRFFLRLDDRRFDENTQVKASHILIEFGNDKDSAKAEALKFMALAQSGQPFDSLAREHSKDPGSGSKGGDLGYFSKGRMVPEFEEAAFALDSGEISQPVETQFGWHVIKVTDKISEELKYSVIEIKTSISSPTKNMIFRDAFSFHKQVQEGENFNALAEKLGVKPIETPFFTKQRPILGSQYITDMAFENEPGYVMEPLELKYHGVVVAQVAEAREEGIIPLAEKSEEIRKKLLEEKKVDALKNKANEIYNRVKSYGSLQAAAAGDTTLEVISDSSFMMSASPVGIRKDVLLNQAVFSKDTPTGKILPPVKGENGWYIVQIHSREIADPNTIPQEEILSFKKNLQKSQIQRAFYDWFREIRKQADIDDRRSEFYKYY